MFSYNKIINWGALLLFLWLAHKYYQHNRDSYSIAPTHSSGAGASMVIDIDKNKKYEDYSWSEKLAYRLFAPKSEKKPALGSAQALKINGDIMLCCVSYSALKVDWCKALGIRYNFAKKNGEIALPDIIYASISDMKIGEKRRVVAPYSKFGTGEDTPGFAEFDIEVKDFQS